MSARHNCRESCFYLQAAPRRVEAAITGLGWATLTLIMVTGIPLTYQRGASKRDWLGAIGAVIFTESWQRWLHRQRSLLYLHHDTGS